MKILCAYLDIPACSLFSSPFENESSDVGLPNSDPSETKEASVATVVLTTLRSRSSPVRSTVVLSAGNTDLDSFFKQHLQSVELVFGILASAGSTGSELVKEDRKALFVPLRIEEVVFSLRALTIFGSSVGHS